MKASYLYKSVSLLVSKRQTRKELKNLSPSLLEDVALSQEQVNLELKKNSAKSLFVALKSIVLGIPTRVNKSFCSNRPSVDI